MNLPQSLSLLATTALLVSSAGCSSSIGKAVAKKEYFQPGNFHQSSAWIPDDVRRVAVLPVNTADPDHITSVMHRQVDLFVGDAIAATGIFEVVRVTPKQLKALTGQHYWGIDSALPEDFFATLSDRLDCDAVIFSELTVFRPYEPVAIGWKLHLVDAREPQVLWAADHVFDAGNPAVANSAVRFSEQNLNTTAGHGSQTILRSPFQFGQYSLAASFATLQGREKY